MYCFDTDVLSATMRREPDLALIRRLAQLPPSEQFTTAITLGELLYGAERRGSDRLASSRARPPRRRSHRPSLRRGGRRGLRLPARQPRGRAANRLDEPDLRIASIALSRDLTLVTANLRHFDRVPGLSVENWLA